LRQYLIAKENVDGFLVGGASLRADDFLSIIRTVSEAESLVANGKETGQT
jgi:triosephosphate isomerase